MVEEIKELATSQEFTGEYLVEEILWKTAREIGWPGEPVSAPIAGKYYARAIIMHRGLNVIVSINLWGIRTIFDLIHNVSDTMAGAKPISFPIEIQSEATNIKSYSFSLSNGDKLVALWTDGVAVEDDPGITTTLILPGFSDQRVTGIDVLHGFQQQMITDMEDGDLVIRDLLVKDYPIILRLAPTRYVFLPIALKGHAQ